jgi:dihydrofolate reductase/thymidylate synthase
MKKFNVILATDLNGGFGLKNDLPWDLPTDFNFFKSITNSHSILSGINTTDNILIMGRNTFEQMKLVKNQINIIISSTLNTIETTEEFYIFKTIDESIKFLNEIKYNNIFVCGGKNIYDYFLNNNQYDINLYWTLLNKSYNCDNIINIQQLLKFVNQYHIINTYDCYDINNNQLITTNFYRPKYNTNNIEEQKYINVMQSIITSGKYTQCRNGYTYSKFGEILRFNLESFPLLTTKKMFFKGIFEELMYFIKGDTNSKHLLDKNIKIWEKNTTKEFIEKCNLPYEEYDMGPMYGFQWRHFNALYNGMNENYDNKGFDQLKYILNELKTNPNSRRILMTTYNPAQAQEGVLFPCHGISIQFNTEHIIDNRYKLNISQNQRSCDYFLGVPFNIASYALLNYMICHILNNDSECKFKYEPGELIMFLGDYHIYKEHLIQARRQIMRIPKKFPQLVFKRNITNIEDFKLEDIDIVDYDSYPYIQADMIA